MEWLAVGTSEELAQRWIAVIEDQDECWRCRFVRAGEPLPAAEAVLLLPGSRGAALSLPPPYVFDCGGGHPLADGRCSLREAAGLRELLERWRRQGRIPLGAAAMLPQVTCQARAALISLGMPERLRAWTFLPDMLALCAVHPPLTAGLSAGLYPLIARRHGCSAYQVERSLRLAIEATWNRAALAGLEQFFGQSVDPERGKPTNREFLLRMSQVVRK